MIAIGKLLAMVVFFIFISCIYKWLGFEKTVIILLSIIYFEIPTKKK